MGNLHLFFKGLEHIILYKRANVIWDDMWPHNNNINKIYYRDIILIVQHCK